jgi:hypothetical protein
MGQVPDDLNEIPAVEKEVDALRERTQHLVAELERRLRARAGQARELVANTQATMERVRHAVDLKAQFREHKGAFIGAGGAAAVALGVGVYFAVARMMERRKPMNRLMSRAEGYRALLADPHRAMRKQEPFVKRLVSSLIIAGATSILGTLSVILTKRATRRLLPPPQTIEMEIIEPAQ